LRLHRQLDNQGAALLHITSNDGREASAQLLPGRGAAVDHAYRSRRHALTWLPDWLSSCNPFDDDGAQDDFLPDHLPDHEDEVDPFAEPGGVRKMKKSKGGRKKKKARDQKDKAVRRRRRAAAAQRKRDDAEREEEAEQGQP
jgi:hypothetical protein